MTSPLPSPGRSPSRFFELLAVLFILSLQDAGRCDPRPSRHKPTPPKPALILYDSSGPYGWIGGLHARMLANLLGHFDLDYTIEPVESYRGDSIRDSRATFYFGSVFDNPLPRAFLQDVLAAEGPVCWFKYNLWQVGREAAFSSQFEIRTGFRFEFMDSSDYERVNYKGETFSRSPLDAELGVTTILDPGLAAAPALACQPSGSNCIPYIVHGGNFWYVADTPFSFISEEDRYLVFADLLHDILQISHPESHRAVIRLEDIDPTYSTDLLVNAADELHAEGVPFLVSVIPVYVDPRGIYNGGVPETVPMADAPAFVQALEYMESRGGQIVLHGYTHQYDSVANPYTGVSGDDYEFFRVTVDAQNAMVDYMPVPQDSKHWVQSRIHGALSQLKHTRLEAVAWETPHYAASALDYTIFADRFPLTIQRALYFDEAGRVVGKNGKRRGMFDSGSHNAGQFFPYVIQRDLYGQKIIPENIGNIELAPLGGAPARLPEDLVRAASRNLVVRDGWASGFFHPFLNLSYLQGVVRGVKALGYEYVPLSADMR